MKAVLFEKYGPPEVLRVAEVERPVPLTDELLVRIVAAGVNRSDCGTRGTKPFFVRIFTGILRPKRPFTGREFSGVVEERGAQVTEFEIGDEVFGIAIGGRGGTHAEYVCIKESAPIAKKPTNVNFEEAAGACDGAILAKKFMERGGVAAGTRLLVYGASGSVGTAAVQIAKSLGAHVTAVCGSTAIETVRSLGPDQIINYQQENFWDRPETYEVILDAWGQLSFLKSRTALTATGIFIATDLGARYINPLLILFTMRSRRRVVLPIPGYKKADVEWLKQLMEDGAFRPVISRRFVLGEIAAAVSHVDAGQKLGNIVLTISTANSI